MLGSYMANNFQNAQRMATVPVFFPRVHLRRGIFHFWCLDIERLAKFHRWVFRKLEKWICVGSWRADSSENGSEGEYVWNVSSRRWSGASNPLKWERRVIYILLLWDNNIWIKIYDVPHIWIWTSAYTLFKVYECDWCVSNSILFELVYICICTRQIPFEDERA